MPPFHLTLSVVLDLKLAVCRLDSQTAIPEWVFQSDPTFVSITRTTEELSIVCEQSVVPEGIESQKDWFALKVEGPLDFSLTGILFSISEPLAHAKISIFAISTFNTDYILIKEHNRQNALEVLKKHFIIHE